MKTLFNEDNTMEQMIISILKENGWTYIPAEDLPRMYSDVMVEPMVKEALIRLNPEIAAEPSRADEVIYKLRTVILSVQPHNLVPQNRQFRACLKIGGMPNGERFFRQSRQIFVDGLTPGKKIERRVAEKDPPLWAFSHFSNKA